MAFRGGGGRHAFSEAASRDHRVDAPREPRRRTARKIVGFFRPYRLQILVVFGAIVAERWLEAQEVHLPDPAAATAR